MAIHCFYHSGDNDGEASGAIVKMKYPECELIGINYGYDFPFEKITKDDTVFLVDFCLEPVSNMVKLDKACHRLVWIDHHVSSIKSVAEAGLDPDGIRVIGRSGCELVWEFLFHGKRMPFPVYLIGRFDVWDNSDPQCRTFMYGMMLEDSQPTNDALWGKLLNDDPRTIEAILKHGDVIGPYQVKQNAKIAKIRSFESKFDEYDAIVMNTHGRGSLPFDSVYDPDKHDIMISFVVRVDRISGSFYTESSTVDVSELATKYGGGGHAQAAGFVFENAQEFFDKLDIKK